VKNYILDTNVLLHDPNSLLAFKGNTVLIPIEVLEEIDRFKRESSELGQNARTVSRTWTLARQGPSEQRGQTGERRHACALFSTRKTARNGPPFGNNTVDSRIVSLALAVQKAEPKTPAILVTKDINLRIKADSLGAGGGLRNDRVLLTELYTGMIELTIRPKKCRASAWRANWTSTATANISPTNTAR
jgi:PhoH-like ATPase